MSLGLSLYFQVRIGWSCILHYIGNSTINAPSLQVFSCQSRHPVHYQSAIAQEVYASSKIWEMRSGAGFGRSSTIVIS
jgi:hypothetical protein